MSRYFLSPSGRDANTGTDERNPWKTFAAANQRLQPGDELRLLVGLHAGTFRPPNGTAQAPIRLTAVGLDAIIDGGAVGGTWTRGADGTWSHPWGSPAFGAWQGNFEQLGKNCALWWRDYNQYGSNPTLDIDPRDPAPQFKLKGGRLYVRTLNGTEPIAAGVIVAITELAIDLNGRSHVIVEGVTTRHHKIAVGTQNGDDIHLSGCDFGYTGTTQVWLVGLTNSEMVKCHLQGAGAWNGHYEDLCQVNDCSPRIADCDLSYGGHCGILCLGPGAPVIDGNRYSAMGGTLLLLKQDINGAKIRNNTFRGAAWVRDLTVHRVPHAAIQLSGVGNTIVNNLFEQCGVGILASSTNVQPCRQNLVERNTFQDTEGAAMDWQETETPGGLAGNVIQSNIIRRGCQGKWADGSPQTRLVFFAFANRAGQGLGDNRFEDNYFDASGQIALNGGPMSPTNDSTRTDGRGCVLDAPPPDNGGGNVPGKPNLTSLVPASGPPGTVVRCNGSGFGSNPAVIVSVSVSAAAPSGKKRLENLGGTDTGVVFTLPAEAVDGPVFVRNMNSQQSSNELAFDVTGGSPPPVNQPPVARPGGPYSGVVGQPVQLDGSASSDPDGTIVGYRWNLANGTALEGAKPSVTFPVAGSFTVTLTVTDDKGATNAATAICTIIAQPPSDLIVTLAGTINEVGASYSGTVKAGGPLPAGSTIAVTVKTPDGRTAATLTTLGNPPPPVDPPPTGGIVVSGYSPSPVRAGRSFVITGSGFKSDTLVEWDGQDLQIVAVSPAAITAVAPKETGSGTIVVRQGNDEAAGPSLEVTP